MAEVKKGQKVRVKRHLNVDEVPVGPGVYEVVEDDPGAGQLTVDMAQRVTKKQGNAEVLEESKAKKKGDS